MAQITQIQVRRDTAINWTSVNPILAQGEIGYETDTGKFKIGNGTLAWTNAALLYATDGSKLTGTITATTAGSATTAANLSGTQTQKFVYAAPNGADGTASFRALLASDIPTLNQNTTGTAANVTGIVAVANGGTGVISSTGTGSTVLSTKPVLTDPVADAYYRAGGSQSYNTNGSMSFTAIAGGIITLTGSMTSITLPTLTVMEAGWQSDFSTYIEFSIINTSSSAVTVNGATSHTIVGSALIPTATSARFASRRNNAGTAYVTYRLA